MYIEREFIYDYTEEIPKLIATYDSDGTVVDYYYATDRISTLVTNENGDDVDDTTTGFEQAYALNTDRQGTTRWQRMKMEMLLQTPHMEHGESLRK